MILNSYKYNSGVYGSTYDEKTGVYTNQKGGILEYRAGDVVRHVDGATEDKVVEGIAMIPASNGGEFAMLRFVGGQAAAVWKYVPTNPERIAYGFVVTGAHPKFPGKPCHFAERHATREAAELHAARIRLSSPHNPIQILEREPS